MKYYCFLLLGIICLSCGGLTTIVYDPLLFEEIIEVKLKKDDLYIAANSWMVETFVNAKSVIQFTDKEEGIIKGKYLMYSQDFLERTEDVYAIITINVKDNFTKIIVDPFGKGATIRTYGTPEDDPNYSPITNDPNVYSISNATVDAKVLIETYKQYVQNYTGEW